ncbi:MAG: response regulator [Verrucomicrobiota bacterium]
MSAAQAPDPQLTLLESSSALRSLLDNSREALAVVGEEGTIIYANRSAHQLWGYEDSDMSDLRLSELFAPQFEFVQFQNAALSEGVDTDAEARAADGSLFPIQVNLREIDLELGSGSYRLLSAIDDRCARERETARLQRHSNDALEQFAGGLAHELNNILTGVLGNIHLAMEECGRRGRLQPALLEGAQNAGLRARELTRELLEFASGDRPELCAVSLTDLVRECCHVTLAGSRTKYEIDIPSDLSAAYVDFSQFGQVVHQVVTFADELLGHTGEIRISAENRFVESEEDSFGGELPLGDYCALIVETSDANLSSEEMHHLFEPYSRRSDSYSGLALAISRAIITRHGGIIHGSAAAGGAFRLEIIVPASTDLPTKTVTPLDSGVPELNGANILIMDDQLMVRKVLQHALEALGHRVTACVDGLEAIDLYAESLERGDRYDMVVLDLLIPGGVGGRETCEELLQMDPMANCVVISGDTSDEVMLDHNAYGFVGRIDKPFDVTQLSKIVDEFAGDREDYVTRSESFRTIEEEEEDIALPFEDNIVAIDFQSPPLR